jgi:hypothetical protein
MTSKEAIKFIKECSKDKVCGFIVVPITMENIEEYLEEEETENLSKKETEKILSNVAEELQNLYEDFELEEDLEHFEFDLESLKE